MVLACRDQQRIGRDRVAVATGVPSRTVSRILARHGRLPLAVLDPVTGMVIRASRSTALRYERDAPGDLVHIDVKKLGKIPDGGGWRVTGRGQRPRRLRGLGYDYVHAAIDWGHLPLAGDYSRLGYAEILPDEKGSTCAGFWLRAVAWFAGHGITVRQVMSDNAMNYVNSTDFANALTSTGSQHNERTHEPLIDDDTFAAVRGRLASRVRGERKPRSSSHAYVLRGLIFCSVCGRRMEGAWRANRNEETPGRVLYRCVVKQNRAVAILPNHPSSMYVREDAILGPLDHWIATLTSPESLEAHQHPSSHDSPGQALRTRIADLDRKISSLVAAVEAGADLPQLTDQLKRRASERSGLEAQLRAVPREHHLSSDDLRAAIAELGGMPKILASANPAAREKVYQSLGIRLEYDHAARLVTANAAEACVFNRVRRGT